MPSVKRPGRTRHHTYIRQWRDFRRLTQDQVAERIGISRVNYGRIEAGKVPYNQDFLELCAEALKCTKADLLERDPVTESLVDQLRAVLGRATEDQQLIVLRVAKSLIENNH